MKSLKENEAEKHKWRNLRKRQKRGTCVRQRMCEGERNEAERKKEREREKKLERERKKKERERKRKI